MTKEEVAILVVDDVNTMRSQIKDLLLSFGFRGIKLASNFPEANVLLDSQQFHLVLADWHAEPGDGLQFLKQIRAHARNKDAAFIMVTAESTKERVIEAIKSGVDDYLVKPLTIGQIQTKVHAALVKRKVL